MIHAEGGASLVEGNGDIKTKAKLRGFIKEQPESIWLYSTSQVTNQWSGRANELPPNIEFLVVGPNPYQKRDWYATVYRGRGGVLRVK